jgi:hypothetical protein
LIDGKTRRVSNTENRNAEENIFLKDHVAVVRMGEEWPRANMFRKKQRNFPNDR